MKTKEFWIPCTFEERKPLLLDKLFFIPDHYSEHQKFYFPKWSDKEIFGNDKPVVVEYCSGNGQWILDRAVQYPNINWVAIEKRFDRVRKIWKKLHRNNISNVYIIFGEAQTFTKEYLQESSVDETYMNFPDPWPKTKHAKHRIVQPDFVKDLSKALKPKASATFVTDNEQYSEQIISTFLSDIQWTSKFADPYFTHEWPDFGASFFEELWKSKGLSIRYHQFINNK